MDANDNLSELQTIMFGQITRLSDPTIDLDKELKRASALVQLGNVVIHANRVQIDAVRVNHQANKNGKLIPLKEGKKPNVGIEDAQ